LLGLLGWLCLLVGLIANSNISSTIPGIVTKPTGIDTVLSEPKTVVINKNELKANGTSVISGFHIEWHISLYTITPIWQRYRVTATCMPNANSRSDQINSIIYSYKDPNAALYEGIINIFGQLFEKGIIQTPASHQGLHTIIPNEQLPRVDLPIMEDQ